MIPPTSSRKEIEGYKASVHRQITRIKRIDNETLFIEDEKKLFKEVCHWGQGKAWLNFSLIGTHLQLD